MTWNENNGASINERIAETFYGEKMREEELKKRTRDGLLHRLGGALSPVQVLYSSIDELKKMEEKRKKKFEGVSTGYALPVDGKDPGETPMRDFISRQEYLKQNMCKLNDKKMIPGVNACSATPIDNRKLSPKTYAKLRELLKMKEGYDENAYKPIGDDVWTIGYGHTKNVKPGDKITKEEAEKLFEEDMKEHLDSLKHVKTRLTENQKAALGSLIYNIGGTKFYHSKMLKKLNANDIKGAADEFDDFIKKNNKIINGLIDRRKSEKELFLTPDED